jgi:beta-lactamase superfamily II metal-dependent hydrolase
MGKLHCLKVGCADASVIVTDSFTFLVDCEDIESHAQVLPASKQIQGVFITHQHDDHHSGLEFLRRKGYSIRCLIYSPYERRYGDASVTLEEWNDFVSHRDYFASKGTGLYAPYRQDSFEEPYWTIGGIKFWMLGPEKGIASSATRELHDACLVFRADLGVGVEKRQCTFTGDASDLNLNWIARNTNHICDDILHASHHGSINGSDLAFIKACKIKQTLISTEEGVYDNVPHATALKRYEDNTSGKVYRTDVDGSLIWTF